MENKENPPLFQNKRAAPFYFCVVIALVCLSGACVTGAGLFAPKFIAEGVHLDAREMTENQCLECHRDGKDGVPIAPRAMLNRKNCIRCHLSSYMNNSG